MKRFLIVKTSAIGDVIQTLPILSYIKNRTPDAWIGWIAERSCRDLLKAHPLIDKVYTIDTKQWRSKPFQLETWKAIRAAVLDVTFRRTTTSQPKGEHQHPWQRSYDIL